ncbi:DUF6527 family protein [Cellulomonas fimi]|uniref:DUF6527 family protein n=1 Tax=Cellulomonas fimi TaxID=1708 RepID=UPI0035D722F6
MSHVHSVDHRFVELLPTPLERGVLYISGAHDIVAHLCLCGCGNEVVTPLGPAGWVLRYDGRVSLSPSIGNGALPCKSHYVIQGSRVHWLSKMTEDQHHRAQARDRDAVRGLNPTRLGRAKRLFTSLLRRGRV